MAECVDYRSVFSRVLYELMVEEFVEKRGIDTIDADYFDQMVEEIARENFWPTVEEFREATGYKRIRVKMGWRANI